MKGKLIVIYGINNIGKTTQSNLLKEALVSKGFKVEQIKFPDYKLEPTGPKIYSILRAEKQLISEKEFQTLTIENLKQVQPRIRKLLDEGTMVIAEDYYGTTIAWGSAKGLDEEWLKKETSFAVKEDIAILLDGERFVDSKEEKHIHEHDEELMEKVRNRFLSMANEYDWKIINANQSKSEVHEQILEEVEEIL